MIRALLISVALGACILAGCTMETRVVKDNSIEHQLRGINKDGWTVSGGAFDEERKSQQARNPNVYTGKSDFPLDGSHAAWSTNFQLDHSPAEPGSMEELLRGTPAAPTQPPKK